MNIMPANGREVVLGPGIKPRWTASAVGSKSTWYDGGSEANAAAGIFRVWSTKFGESGGLWRRDYPLTENARKARAKFNLITDTIAPGCRPKGMPTIMGQPYPIEFVNKGDLGPHLPTMCGASLSMQTYSPISSFVLRSATLLMTHGFE
jgi:hypothetical protein